MSRSDRGDDEVFIEGYRDQPDTGAESAPERAEFVDDNADAPLGEYTPTSIEPFDGKAALDSSGRFYHLIGVDTEGQAHYLKDRGSYGDVLELDLEDGVVAEERIKYRHGFNPRRLATYVVETEWAAVNEYGMAWAEKYFDEDDVLEP